MYAPVHDCNSVVLYIWPSLFFWYQGVCVYILFYIKWERERERRSEKKSARKWVCVRESKSRKERQIYSCCVGLLRAPVSTLQVCFNALVGWVFLLLLILMLVFFLIKHDWLIFSFCCEVLSSCPHEHFGLQSSLKKTKIHSMDMKEERMEPFFCGKTTWITDVFIKQPALAFFSTSPDVG